MTTSQMLSELRLKLDAEYDTTSYPDTDLYIALSKAQEEIANFLVESYRVAIKKGQAQLPTNLGQLVSNLSGQASLTGVYNTSSVLILELVNTKYGAFGATQYPCIIKQHNAEFDFDNNNIFLGPVSEEPIVTLTSSYNTDGTINQGIQRLTFLPKPNSATFGYFSATIVKKPIPISASIEPELHDATHRVIVQGAFVELLNKFEKPLGDAAGMYNSMLGTIL